MEPEPLDPEEILNRLRDEHKVLAWAPLPPDEEPVSGDEVIRNRDSLEYLHHHWTLPDSFDPSDAGTGIRGRLVALFGRLTYRVLGRYMTEERNLLAHVVQVNEALEQRCNELSLRCEQISTNILNRQAAEAANQAKLALWLHLDGSSLANPEGSDGESFEAGDLSSPA